MPITSVLRGQIRPLAGYKDKGYTFSVKKPSCGRTNKRNNNQKQRRGTNMRGIKEPLLSVLRVNNEISVLLNY